MRLLSRAALVVAATLLVAPALHAQTSFSIAAGAAVPIGETGDALNTGYNVTLGLGIKPPLAPIGARIEAGLNGMEGKAAGTGNWRIIGLTANATLSGPALPMGYLIGGIGMYNTDVSDLAVDVDAENDFGFNIGAGLNFPLTGFSTFLEARVHIVNTEGSSIKFVPITFGLKF